MRCRFDKSENKWICPYCGKHLEDKEPFVSWQDSGDCCYDGAGETRAHTSCDKADKEYRREVQKHCWEYEEKYERCMGRMD